MARNVVRAARNSAITVTPGDVNPIHAANFALFDCKKSPIGRPPWKQRGHHQNLKKVDTGSLEKPDQHLAGCLGFPIHKKNAILLYGI
jgi:hypothetical protein